MGFLRRDDDVGFRNDSFADIGNPPAERGPRLLGQDKIGTSENAGENTRKNNR